MVGVKRWGLDSAYSREEVVPGSSETGKHTHGDGVHNEDMPLKELSAMIITR